MERYTAKELEGMETLHQGQADDCKIDEDGTRVWLCRCGVADGMPYDNQITIEKYDLKSGRWETVETYQG